ncbi:MAG: Fic family protein [Pirellulales bacterium]|nr:Fic family protein [Pirellulales bacterium]
MRIPKSPPDLTEILRGDGIATLLARLADADVVDFVRRSNDGYLHWHKLRYHPLPNGLDADTSWAAVALSRIQHFEALPICFKSLDSHLRYWNPPQHQYWLHQIDQQAGGSLGSHSIHVGGDRDRYLINSLMEEAIASSQLEGAATTRQAAKKMLREGRRPKNKAERMILNNYQAIHRIRDCVNDRLSVALLKELHSILTVDTLDDSSSAGRFRKPGDVIVVEDAYTHDVLHTPPSAESLDLRIEEICEFANNRSKPFIHPVIKAIILHFAIGYVHPFEDGNGRTARAVFYWYMLKHGYWLFEFLPISRLFVRAPAKYVRAYLYTESDGGDVTYFIHYNLHVIIRAIRELQEYLSRQQARISEAARLLRGKPDLNHRQKALISHALGHPDCIYTIQEHRSSHGVCYATARADLLELVENGYLALVGRKNKLRFSPHEELLPQLRKALASISEPMSKAEPPPQLAVTRAQPRETPSSGATDALSSDSQNEQLQQLPLFRNGT